MAKKEKPEHDEAAAEARNMIAITRALSDPTRLALFRHIANQENASCMEMRECISLSPATLSHHMRQLESAGLVETHRDGKLLRAEVRRKAWKNYLAWLKDLA